MSIKKRYLKTKPICKVTFRLSKKAAKGAEKVYLVGDLIERWFFLKSFRFAAGKRISISLSLR